MSKDHCSRCPISLNTFYTARCVQQWGLNSCFRLSFQCPALLYSQGPGLVNLAGVMVALEETIETVANYRIFLGSWAAVEIGS